jgi:hypothetical protein
MLHSCAQRFDVTGDRGNILGSERGQYIVTKLHWSQITMSYISNSSPRLVLQLSIKYFFFSKTQENRASLYLEEKEGRDPKYNTPHHPPKC